MVQQATSCCCYELLRADVFGSDKQWYSVLSYLALLGSATVVATVMTVPVLPNVCLPDGIDWQHATAARASFRIESRCQFSFILLSTA